MRILDIEALDEKALRECSPVALAYIGDAVFELAARTHLLSQGKRKIRDLHLEVVALVRAESQARVIREILQELSEEEQDIVRRGRNAKSTPPRHTGLGDYRMSTGFEALLGYTYLKGDETRLKSLLERALAGSEQLDAGEDDE